MPSGILLIDKAPDWTSHDVVAKCRGLLREKKIGHAGTLDPMATGLLVLFAGRATRAIPYFPGHKTYRAALRFGVETDTQDSTGRPVRTYAHIPGAQALRDLLPRFTGEILQVPPMVSALRVNGQRLYKLAREGKEVARAPRPVTVHRLAYIEERDGEHFLEVSCSAGTYVRTLIHDMGQALGSGAVMTALRRVSSGPFSVDDALPTERAAWEHLIPIERLFAPYPAATVPDTCLARVLNGGDFPAPAGLPPGLCRAYDGTGRFLLLGECEGGVVRTVKSFFEVMP